MKNFFRSMTSNVGIVGQLLSFLWQRKLWWLIPMVAVLLLFGLLLIFASASGVGPFIYTLFSTNRRALRPRKVFALAPRVEGRLGRTRDATPSGDLSQGTCGGDALFRRSIFLARVLDLSDVQRWV